MTDQSFKVTVLDSESNPIQGVSIDALFQSTGLKSLGQTTENGSFFIISPPIDEPFRITFTKEGYEKKSVTWVIKSDGGFKIGEIDFEAGTPAEITLVNGTVSFITSFIVKNSSDKALSGKVIISTVDGEGNKSEIDSIEFTNGVFSFDEFEKSKNYVLEFSSDGYFNNDVEIDFESESKKLTVELTKTGLPPSGTATVTLPVEIKNEFGESIAGINVTVKRYDSTTISTNTTYASGTASLTQIPTGTQIQIVATDPNGIYLTTRTSYFELEVGKAVEKQEIIMEGSKDENKLIVNVTTNYYGGLSSADVTLLKDSAIIDSDKTDSTGQIVFL
ncbi:MAG: carboxypeptidase regulatory-like domain-containing protein, partial [Candidatus Diapherotrites archaeon]|nr:carboxypeptidase regulatory-like domain-containing protein [Candidatus Diapherotrites archaeon]